MVYLQTDGKHQCINMKNINVNINIKLQRNFSTSPEALTICSFNILWVCLVTCISNCKISLPFRWNSNYKQNIDKISQPAPEILRNCHFDILCLSRFEHANYQYHSSTQFRNTDNLANFGTGIPGHAWLCQRLIFNLGNIKYHSQYVELVNIYLHAKSQDDFYY